MKIIDLLNKIANGEEVPEKIKYRNKIFIYDKDNQCYVVENYNEYNDLLMELSNHKGTDLKYEVEIIEEEKKIPERVPNAEVFEVPKLNNMELSNIALTNKEDIRIIKDTLNKVLNYFKSKGE